MDVPPIADATPEPVLPPPAPSPSPPPGLEHRLAALEAELAEVNERLDALGVSLEASLREAVTQEVQAVSGDLRHTVAELGRLLVRDLGKLSKLLSEHRDAIVAELRPPPPPEPEPEPPAPLDLEPQDMEEPEVATVPPSPDASERRRASRLRRRHG